MNDDTDDMLSSHSESFLEAIRDYIDAKRNEEEALRNGCNYIVMETVKESVEAAKIEAGKELQKFIQVFGR